MYTVFVSGPCRSAGRSSNQGIQQLHFAHAPLGVGDPGRGVGLRVACRAGAAFRALHAERPGAALLRIGTEGPSGPSGIHLACFLLLGADALRRPRHGGVRRGGRSRRFDRTRDRRRRGPSSVGRFRVGSGRIGKAVGRLRSGTAHPLCSLARQRGVAEGTHPPQLHHHRHGRLGLGRHSRRRGALPISGADDREWFRRPAPAGRRDLVDAGCARWHAARRPEQWVDRPDRRERTRGSDARRNKWHPGRRDIGAHGVPRWNIVGGLSERSGLATVGRYRVGGESRPDRAHRLPPRDLARRDLGGEPGKRRRSLRPQQSSGPAPGQPHDRVTRGHALVDDRGSRREPLVRPERRRFAAAQGLRGIRVLHRPLAYRREAAAAGPGRLCGRAARRRLRPLRQCHVGWHRRRPGRHPGRKERGNTQRPRGPAQQLHLRAGLRHPRTPVGRQRRRRELPGAEGQRTPAGAERNHA